MMSLRAFEAAARHLSLTRAASELNVTPGAVSKQVKMLEEEIGRVSGHMELLCEFFNTPGFCDEYSYLYLATELEETARNAVSAEEAHMQIERVPLDRVEAMIAAREIVDAKSIIGLLLAKQHLAGRT